MRKLFLIAAAVLLGFGVPAARPLRFAVEACARSRVPRCKGFPHPQRRRRTRARQRLLRRRKLHRSCPRPETAARPGRPGVRSADPGAQRRRAGRRFGGTDLRDLSPAGRKSGARPEGPGRGVPHAGPQRQREVGGAGRRRRAAAVPVGHAAHHRNQLSEGGAETGGFPQHHGGRTQARRHPCDSETGTVETHARPRVSPAQRGSSPFFRTASGSTAISPAAATISAAYCPIRKASRPNR